MTQLPTFDHQLGEMFLAALTGGPVTVEHARTPGLASTYDPHSGVVTLNPDATADEQSRGLLHALSAFVTADVAAGEPVAPVRPSLYLVPGCAR